jgi:hypothetical protein
MSLVEEIEAIYKEAVSELSKLNSEDELDNKKNIFVGRKVS